MKWHVMKVYLNKLYESVLAVVSSIYDLVDNYFSMSGWVYDF